MQRSCSLRCHSFVTPGPCPPPAREIVEQKNTSQLHRMERARFVTPTIDSTRISLFWSVYILCDSPLFYLCWSVVCNLSSPGSFYFHFSLFAFLQSYLNINIVRARMSECRSYKTRLFGGPYFRFRSL